MAALQSYCLCFKDFTASSTVSGSENSYKSQNVRWKAPRSAMITDARLPMRSYEVKNRTNVNESAGNF